MVPRDRIELPTRGFSVYKMLRTPCINENEETRKRNQIVTLIASGYFLIYGVFCCYGRKMVAVRIYELNRKFNTTNGKPTKKGRFDAFFDKDGFVSDEALKKLLGKHCIDPRSGEEVVEFCKQWNISVAVQPDFSYKELHEVIASIFTENFNDVNIVGITAPTEATIRGMISHPTLKNR